MPIILIGPGVSAVKRILESLYHQPHALLGKPQTRIFVASSKAKIRIWGQCLVRRVIGKLLLVLPLLFGPPERRFLLPTPSLSAIPALTRSTISARSNPATGVLLKGAIGAAKEQIGTGLLRCYISRVENGHTIPAIETLEKLARAFEIPMYKLFYDGEEPPKAPNISVRKSSGESGWGSSGKDAKYFSQLRRLLSKSSENDRKLILYTAQKMARE